MLLDRKALAYASSALAASMMQAAFSFYYINVYLQRFHVSRGWFQVAQVLFMVWNAINDPLFAYVQDNYRFSIVKSRRHSILYGAPLLAVAFVVVWFPWGDYSEGGWLVGVQLTVSLCFYDAVYTFVLLAQSALFHDLSPVQEDRVRLVRYSQVASTIGSSSVFFCALVSANLERYWAFECACVFIALLSVVFLSYTGLHATTEYDDANLKLNSSPEVAEPAPDKPEVRCRRSSVVGQTFAIVRQPNFMCFVLMNFLHIYHATFIANFTGVICDQVIPSNYLSSTARSLFYGALFLLPQIILVMGSSVVTWIGYFRIIRLTFAVKAGLGLWLLYVGPQPWAVIIFFLFISTTSAGAYPLFNLCLSDIIDEDMSKNHRRTPQSSMVFGANALITKPAVSLAPMVSVAILGHYGYQHDRTDQRLTLEDNADVAVAMFYLAAVTPVVIGALQFAVWSGYTLRETHKAAKVSADV